MEARKIAFYQPSQSQIDEASSKMLRGSRFLTDYSYTGRSGITLDMIKKEMPLIEQFQIIAESARQFLSESEKAAEYRSGGCLGVGTNLLSQPFNTQRIKLFTSFAKVLRSIPNLRVSNVNQGYMPWLENPNLITIWWNSAKEKDALTIPHDPRMNEALRAATRMLAEVQQFYVHTETRTEPLSGL